MRTFSIFEFVSRSDMYDVSVCNRQTLEFVSQVYHAKTKLGHEIALSCVLDTSSKLVYPATKPFEAIIEMVRDDSKFGIDVRSGDVGLIDNAHVLSVQYLMDSRNWFKNADAWRELGMTKDVEDLITQELSFLTDMSVTVSSVDGSKFDIQSVVGLYL